MKINFIPIIVLFIFLLSSFIPVSGDNKSISPPIIQEIVATPNYFVANISKVVTLEKSPKMKMSSKGSYIIYDTEYDDFHPTLAGDTSGRFFACFEVTNNGMDYYPDFWYSLDDGMTWEEAGYFSESLGAAYPDVDSNENGFCGTFSGSEINSGEQWLIIAEDLEAITGRVWDWSPDFDDFKFMTISCCKSGGGMAATGDKHTFPELDDCPLLFDKRGISWLELEGYLHTDISVDEVTEVSYAVYDHTVDAKLLVRIDNFSSGEFIRSFLIGNGVTKLRNPSIEAHDDAVVLVCEEEGNIVCFYSSNGFSSVQKSTVVISAQFPEVKDTFDGEIFACSYVKDVAIYRRISEDGGATWTHEGQVQDSQAVNEYGSHDLGKGKKGIYSIWEDIRGTDRDIYFGQNIEIPYPDLEITSIKGPIGVTAKIKNIGGAEVTNVEWTIKVIGGFLNKINKETHNSELTLAADAEIKAKSGIIIGFGPILVVVTVTCDESVWIEEEVRGTQILFFSFI